MGKNAFYPVNTLLNRCDAAQPMTGGMTMRKLLLIALLSAALAGCGPGGAAWLTWCDVAARTRFGPYELPVGGVLSLAGGPFFLWLLFRKGRGHP